MRRKTLTTALLAGITGAAGIAGVANAVYQNSDGTGELLTYPYYTTRDDNVTLMSLVNTTNQTKAVKIRFLEGYASQEVLDFNLYMSPFDVWTAIISDSGSGGKVATKDTTCSVPYLFAKGDVGENFRSTVYAGDLVDQTQLLGDPILNRTREGYIQAIEMGDVIDPDLANAAIHINGVPFDCDALRDAWLPGGFWIINGRKAGMTPPSGGLFGGGSVVNVPDGTMISYNAVAIDDWADLEIPHFAPGDILPSIESGDSITSRVFANGQTIETNWLNGSTVNAVSAIFMHNQVMNEYAMDAVVEAATDWVMTFPTKRFYVNSFNGTADQPFGSTSEVGAAPTFPFCEFVQLGIWDREEATPGSEIDFSPTDIALNPTLCWEVAVLEFQFNGVANPLFNTELLNTINSEFENGWAQLTFNENEHLLGFDLDLNQNQNLEGHQFRGLPVIGFAAQRFVNGQLEFEGNQVLANYAGAFTHRYNRNITVSQGGP